MGEANRGLTKAEAHALIDERLRAAVFEIGAQMGTTLHDLMTYPLRTPGDCEKMIAAIDLQRGQAEQAGKGFAEAFSAGLLLAIGHVKHYLEGRTAGH